MALPHYDPEVSHELSTSWSTVISDDFEFKAELVTGTEEDVHDVDRRLEIIQKTQGGILKSLSAKL
jgi:hypothetical protein